MKNNKIVILLFYFLSFSFYAQDKQIDSLTYFFETVQETINNKDHNATIALSKWAIEKYKNNDSINGLANLSIAKTYFSQKQYGASVKHLNIAIDYFTKNGEHKLVNEAYIKLGTLYKLKRDYSTSRGYFLKAIKVLEEHYSNQHENLIEAYQNLITIEKGAGEFDKALSYVQKGITLAKHHKNKEKEAIFITYKGDVFQQQRHFNLAIEQYLEAIQIKEKLFGSIYLGNVVSYHNLAGAYGQLYYLDKAIEYQERSIEINKKLPEGKQASFTSLYGNLAAYYTEFGKLEKAVEYHKKTLFYFEKEFDKNHYLYSISHKNLGDAYYDLKEYANAQKEYQLSLDYNIKKFGSSDISLTEGYTNLALVAKHTGDFDLAEKYLYASLAIYPKDDYLLIPCQLELVNVLIAQKKYTLASTYLDSISKKIPQKELIDLNFDQLKDRKEFIHTKINYFKAIDTKDSDSLTYFYKKAIALDDFTIKEYTTSSTKDFQLAKTFPVYENYIQHIVDLDTKKEAESVFEIFEKSKARKLLESFNKAKNTIKTKVPDSLSKLEQKINVDIIFYEEKKSIEINDPLPESDSLIAVFNTKIFDLKRQKNQLQETFKTTYPNYYDLVYNREVTKIEKIQELLKKEESLVEYFVGENDIFIFIITKNTHKIVKVAKDFPLKNWIEQLRNGIYNYWSMSNASSDEDLKKYNQLYKDMAFKLYQKLVQPIESEITHKVIIIPDGELHFIPFDALLTADSKEISATKNLPYLIKKYQISYNYSATLYNQLKQKESSNSTNDVLAFAPKFTNGETVETIAMRRNGLGNLKYNTVEVDAIDNLFDTNVFKDSSATKSNFISNAKNHKIIHLSTHAKSNDTYGDYSFIAFSKNDPLQKNKLYVRELYNLDLDADMVVLSACETGIGELKKGEGVISLARAFTYAGARSTITSLWNVNDAQTTKLMTLFYTNLKEGMPKDEALRTAKLTYIESENLTSPYFWAAFTPTGDMKAIELNSNNNIKYIGIGALLLALIFGVRFFLKKRAA
ncbi:CHAT domain-containing protein [Kordia sp.]|uniref:CHAT domain-containing protein n=1 Tax=Kordia sp. TaxID=1965332 RepID=UPI003D6B8740